MWYVRQTLWVGRHGFVESCCAQSGDPEAATWRTHELWQVPIPPWSLPDQDGRPSLVLEDFSLPNAHGHPRGIERWGGGGVRTRTVFERGYPSAAPCACLADTARAFARDPRLPTSRGDYRLLGPNSNTFLVALMRACVDPAFRLPSGGIGGRSAFIRP